MESGYGDPLGFQEANIATSRTRNIINVKTLAPVGPEKSHISILNSLVPQLSEHGMLLTEFHPMTLQYGGGERGEGHAYERSRGAHRLHYLPSSVNFGVWSHLGCSGQNAIIFGHEGII